MGRGLVVHDRSSCSTSQSVFSCQRPSGGAHLRGHLSQMLCHPECGSDSYCTDPHPPLCSQSLKVLQVCLSSLWGVFVSSHQWQLSLHVAILKKQIYQLKDFFPPLFKHVKGVVGLLPAVGISRRLTEDKLRLTAERRMVWNAESISFHLLISHIWSTHMSLLFLPG